ncbi:Toxin RTX-I translocation ATP-binding protein [Symmachiella macrocystis]|uniref:Toxin RTX-I translocation ATP-binding protein n=1 Tax=Symmachiella macrocystis TaxID=2527985 RepID=A0A5C6BQB8_9PLAN|nr:peptidase domain-containing ABC transporter [Symmachiella macrocystis]TWU13581.1 Toxin RTX-I translocation ATP-binding protein [Symmachiella macrocystis]
MNVDQLETCLRDCSCFSLLSDEELAAIRDQADIRHYKLGQVVFRQGDVGDRMYVVYSGKVRVLHEENGDELPLNTLFDGDHFGEMSLVSNAPRNATIRSAADSTLISIPAEAVQSLLEKNGDLRQYFDRYADRLQLWNFIKVVGQLGTQLKPPQLRELVDQFQSQDFPTEDSILTAGEVPEHFYLIQSGRVNVVKEGEVQTTLTSGDTFGGSALVERPPVGSYFTFQADGPVTMLTLAAADFCRLLDDVPQVRTYFEERAAHTRADDAAEHFDTVTTQVRDAAIAAENAAKTTTEPEDIVEPTAPPAALVPVTAMEMPAEEEVAPTGEHVPTPPSTGLGGFWRRYQFPYIPQHEEVDCGAASLAMITAHHGRPVGVSRLRDLAGVSTMGASLTQLIHAAHEVGYETRSLKLTADRLPKLQLPAVLFWQGYHYVVLYALNENYAYIADPAMGKCRVTLEELETQFSGFALEVTPTAAAERIRTKPKAAQRLTNLMKSNFKTLGVILAISLLLQVVGLAAPLFTKYIIDSVLMPADAGPPDGTAPPGSLLSLNWLALGLVVVSVFGIGMTMLRGMVAVRLSQKLDRTMLHEFYEHLLQLPTRFFKLRRTGDIVARFGDNENVRELFTAGTMTVVLDSLMVVVYFVVMFMLNARLAAVVLAFVPVFVAFTLIVSPIMKLMHRRLMEDGAAHESNLIESIGGIDMVKAMAVEKPMQKKWELLFEKYLKSQYRSEKLGETFGAIDGAIGVFSNVALLWYGLTLVQRNELTLGDFMAFNMLAGQVIGPLSGVIGLWDQLQQARVSLERLSDVLDNDPEPQPPPEERVYPKVIRGRVKFDRVFFHYGTKGAPYVLRNLSFEAAPGQRIAIVGRSGSGKTTLARLLLGLYQPTEGTITIDDWDLERIDLGTLRKQIGFVLQENLLFSGTILENIALGDENPDRQQVEEAATLAGAHDFIRAMPLGYDMVVGEFGLTLSGGQRQRISIARALYRNPRIVVMDEATSALDSLSEREIQKNLDAILADRTSFIIAHKIATVRDADQILVLHDGAIVETGTHDELIAKRGTYYYLAAQQLNL